MILVRTAPEISVASFSKRPRRPAVSRFRFSRRDCLFLWTFSSLICFASSRSAFLFATASRRRFSSRRLCSVAMRPAISRYSSYETIFRSLVPGCCRPGRQSAHALPQEKSTEREHPRSQRPHGE